MSFRPINIIVICSFICRRLDSFILDQQNRPTVETDCGPVLGHHDLTDDGFVFKGIPFASPPVNDLRWKQPVPLAHSNGNCWKGTLDATHFRNICAQRTSKQEISGSEDCLYVNVWTPNINRSAKLAVMVFIHGGSLVGGSGSQDDIGYAPTVKLAVDMNMVHVSLNYRLNAFGFLALDWLANETDTNTSGNYGIMDQIEALRWVQRNIERFGGDSQQVTVYGQSSGATSVFALLASPLCHGLFHRAWLLSGSPILNKTRDDAFRDNLVFVQRSGCQDVQCLYSLSMEQVLNSVPWDVYPYWQSADLTGLPNRGLFDGALAIVDGYVLEYSPLEAWARGLAIDVPVLIGSTAQEADFYMVPVESQNWTWADKTYENHVRSALTPFGDLVANMALTLYPVNTSTPQYQLSSMITDVRVGCGTDYLTQIAASSFQSPVYRYVATFMPPMEVHAYDSPFPSRYSFHGIDNLAFFGKMDILGYNLTDKDHKWIQNIRQEVTHFIKTGSPASATWHSYPETTALLSETTTMSSGYHRAECQFWLTNGFFSYSWIN